MCATLAAAAGCTCGEPAISVDLTVDSRATTTQCVRVVAVPAGAPEEPSGAVVRPPGKDAFEFAVYQGDLPDSINVLARGYDDPSCTRLNEESVKNAVSFVRGQVRHVPLQLNGSPCIGADAGTACPSGVCRSDHACTDAGTEFDCTNGLDDDGDGKKDCADPDCFDVSCAAANLCMVGARCLLDGGCGSATFKSCDTPPGFCFGTPGACSPSSGACAYAPDASIGCDDTNLCTQPDHCLLDGGCGGAPVVCNTPPGACYGTNGSCDPSTGCGYPVRVDGGCDDGNLCTFQDRCDVDAGCAGTPYTCPGTECGTAGNCLGDGGCTPLVAKTGQLCDGGTGVCSASALCLGFPYVPSNFDPGQIAPTLVLADGGLPGSVTLNCAAWFNSTDAGINWCSGQPLPSVTAITQTDGTTPAVVLGMTGLTVNNGSLQVFGSRPVILAVWGDVNVTNNGTISARSVSGADAGAGAMAAGSCGAQDGNVASGTVGAGAGGGSYGTAGGNGGDLTGGGGAQGGNGGGSNGNASITPLRGGCAGGVGGTANGTNAGGAAGLGGGAVQISVAGLLTVDGTVTASGAGAKGGLRDQSGGTEGGNGGGGGGSGGAVLLEANHTLISSTAKLSANGGGGGQGGDSSNAGPNGGNGSDGPTNANTGGLGGSGTSCGSSGTNGGSAAGAPLAAGNIGYTTSGCATGGGGGGSGRIRVNGYAGCQIDAGVQSPLPSFTGPCP